MQPSSTAWIAARKLAWPAIRQGASRPAARRWTGLAVGVAAASWLFAAAGIILMIAHGSSPVFLAYWIMDVAVAIVYGGACLLMLPRSRHPAVWILVLSALGCGISALLTPYLAIAQGNPEVWAPATLWVLSSWVWVPGTYASICVLPWIVSPHARPRWVTGMIGAGIALVVWRVLVLVTARSSRVDNPLAVLPEWFYDLRQTIGLWPDRACVVVALAGTARLFSIWRKGRHGEGRGYGWLAIGQLFLAVAFAPIVFPMPAPLADFATDFAGASLIAAQPFLPGALLVVVLRHRLWGIEVAVDRATVWVLLTAVMVTSYLLVAWLVERTLPASGPVAGLVGFGVALVASQPIRNYLQRRVDDLVYGPVTDPGLLLRSLGEAAGAPDTTAGTIESLVAALATGLRLGGIEVTSADGRVAARSGRLGADALTVPLVVAGQPRGALTVSAAPGQRLDARTRRLVAEMSGVIGVFLELAQANARLDEASARLLEVRHEERRLLRRDLHDGVGPALAGVGLGLAAAQKRLSHDAEGAARLLAELREELDRRTEDVRLLARSLLPAALDDGDLPGALQVLADRFRPSGLTIDVATDRLRHLDTRRQIAIYHVAAEAVVNAHRHGQARNISIRVSGGVAEPAMLEVEDDGQGMGGQRGRGVGLHSMRERAEELCGTLEITSGEARRGTLVRMVLP